MSYSITKIEESAIKSSKIKATKISLGFKKSKKNLSTIEEIKRRNREMVSLPKIFAYFSKMRNS